MPSKKVYLKVSRPFIHGQIKTPAAQEQLALAKRSVGSYFANSNSPRKGTGLTDEEVKILLPQILDVRTTDQDFRKMVENFYTEISTYIPYGDKGLELEIGLELDNDLPVTYSRTEEGPDGKPIVRLNTPLDYEDYVRYKHALGHPQMAASPELAKGNQIMKYYIEDPEMVVKFRLSATEVADQAINEYQKIKTDYDKLKAICTILSPHIKKSMPGEVFVAERYNQEELAIKARTLATEKPAVFYKAITDELLTLKYRLNELIRTGLLKRSGTSIIVAESHEVLGMGEEEAVIALFKTPSNEQLKAVLISAYKERREKEKAIVKS